MKISIIVPVYNVESYLNKCIDSVLSQSYENFELILINDGSEDLSGSICDDYAIKDTRIKVIHQKNSGAAASRNKGISIATGQYLTFLDSDDYWINKDYLHIIIKRLDYKNSDVLSSNFCKVTDGVVSEPYFNPNINLSLNSRYNEVLDFILLNNIWISSACNKIIRKQLFSSFDLRFREKVTSEDIEWSAKLLSCAESLDFINEISFGYVQRCDSVSHKVTVEKVETLINNIKYTEAIVDEIHGLKGDLLNSYLAYQVGVLFFNIVMIESSKEKKRLKKEAKCFVKWLEFTTSKKIKVINYVYRALGYKCMIFLLGLFMKVKKS